MSNIWNTVEPRYNEPLYNEVLGITNDFLYPSNSKIYKTNLVIANTFFQSLGTSLNRGSTVLTFPRIIAPGYYSRKYGICEY